MSLRASVVATVFACSVGISAVVEAHAQARGAGVALDFSPLGAQAVSNFRGSAAPADMNFGPFPLSVLGIENTIRGADKRAADYAEGSLRFDNGPIAYAVLALRDWERHYPRDPWIAKDLLALATFYDDVATPEARACAARAAAWVRHDYPATAYARDAAPLLADAGAAKPPQPPPVAVLPSNDARNAPTAPAAAPPTVAVAAPPPVAVAAPPTVAVAAPEARATLPPYARYDAARPAARAAVAAAPLPSYAVPATGSDR